ncbi:unnamed protein product [Arabis nemorensis]|uniref:Uncharacterized protein n=1 Tax=Arabis nemorensis TaxID=586526 RepID=A0A565CU58_9BRAS|nr:unnamed protein product [Arabis nemorensis]
MSSFLAGFRQQIPRIIGELCAEVEIAPSQLTLPSWGLMNAIQVLSDLSGIFVTGLMVAGAFRVEETAFNSRRFELLPRSGARSPVLIPDWLNPSEEGGHYIYVLHRGPLAISRSWSPPGYPGYLEKLWNRLHNAEGGAHLMGLHRRIQTLEEENQSLANQVKRLKERIEMVKIERDEALSTVHAMGNAIGCLGKGEFHIGGSSLQSKRGRSRSQSSSSPPKKR